MCSAPLVTWSLLHPLRHEGHRNKLEASCWPPEGLAGSVHGSTYQTWKRQCNCPQTTSEQGFPCAEDQGPSLPSEVVSPLLSIFTAGLIGTRVTALSWMTDCVFTSAVLCPCVPGTSWSIFHISSGGKSEAALRLCSHRVQVRVLPGGALGDGAVGRLDALLCSLSTSASHPLPGQLDLVENGIRFVWARFASG